MEKGLQRHHHLLGGGKMRGAAGLMGLQKQNSWSPDIERDEAWERRRRGLMRRAPSSSSLSRARSVTDDDLDELRGCLDLGFEFEPPAASGCAACIEGRTRLVETLPALDLYYAVAVKGGVPPRPARLPRLHIHAGERIFCRWIPWRWERDDKRWGWDGTEKKS
jgi:hypothetical protein